MVCGRDGSVKQGPHKHRHMAALLMEQDNAFPCGAVVPFLILEVHRHLVEDEETLIG